MVKIKDFNFVRGDTQSFTVICTNPDTGLPIDITGYEFFLTVKQSIDDLDADAVIAINESVLPFASEGRVVIHVSNTLTQDLAGTYYYDIQVKAMSGDITTLMMGSMIFAKDTTRRTV